MENSDSIKINLNSDGEILINDNANVVVPNLMATNGVIHAIDRVLISPGTYIVGFSFFFFFLSYIISIFLSFVPVYFRIHTTKN